MALGATRGGVAWMLARQTAVLLGVGLIAGAAATALTAALVRRSPAQDARRCATPTASASASGGWPASAGEKRLHAI